MKILPILTLLLVSFCAPKKSDKVLINIELVCPDIVKKGSNSPLPYLRDGSKVENDFLLWSIADESIGVISKDGIFTAKSNGKTAVFVTDKTSGEIASCEISVI